MGFIRWKWFVTLVLCPLLTKCAADDLPWWKTTTMYQVYPRSFKDSDGDGVGDLKGIIEKASYFKEIGIETVWLSPIQTSPMVDIGYDISNYTDIDPIYGTMEDFKVLMKTLQDLGIKLVLDFVANHSSDKHPWFQKSVAREEPYTSYYVWSNGKIDPKTGKHLPPNNWMSEFGGSVWEWSDRRQQFYLHDFAKAQPNFNFRNPKVIAEMDKIIGFWLDLGVDGFRLDSAKYLFKDDHTKDEPAKKGTKGTKWEDQIHIATQNQPETLTQLERWAQIFYEYSIKPGGKPRALFLEIYDDLEHVSNYYGEGNTSLMQPFNFNLFVHGNISSRASDIKLIIDNWMKVLPEGAATVWVVGNHDNIRVTDRYGPEMADAINLLIAVLPGVSVTYYGEEIAMQDTYIRVDQSVDPRGYPTTRDPERSPMQWDDTISAGFSSNPKTWLPVNPNYWWLNVEAQKSAKSSHLNVFQATMNINKDPIMQKGSFQIFAPDKDTLVVVRALQLSYYVLIINLGSDLTTYTSQSLFAPLNLDMDMQVAIASVNIAGHSVGDILKYKSAQLSMRPKSAVLLRSPPL